MLCRRSSVCGCEHMLCSGARRDRCSRAERWVQSCQNRRVREEGGCLLPSKTAHKCDELVQICSAKPTDGRTEHHHREPEEVLEPFDPLISFSALAEQAVLHDSHRGE